MAIKNTNSNEKILVKVDQNNLVYVDPNSVIKDGIVEPRNIDQEKLVMYVNLEADLVPRSYLLSDTNNTRFVSIVSRTFNLLAPQNGTDLDTSWTDAYNPKPKKNKDTTLTFDRNDFHDSTGQAFGIESINVTIKGTNFIPQITINFIDVRGKTLFEQPSDSPYNTFFHLPWPIFYLTIKGYYGKAIKYRLHLIKFTAKYNDSNGNFDIATSFVGSTFAYLSDIPLNAIINAPYLYASKTENPITFNEKKGTHIQELKRSSKGYMMLKSVYAEMKQKNIIPEDFPVLTLKELEMKAQSLDKTLEKTIFDQVIDPKILSLMDRYNNASIDLIKSVEGWISNYIRPISDVKLPIDQKEQEIFFFIIQQHGLSTIHLVDENKPGSLAYILKEKGDILTKLAQQINTAQMSTVNRRIKPNFKIKTLQGINRYYVKTFNENRQGEEYGIIRDSILSDVYDIQNEFYIESGKIVKILEKEINKIVKNKDLGLGFDPTIRNLFAILMANADVFVRMTKDIHLRAVNAGTLRKEKLMPFNKHETKDGNCIYPWPEIKKEVPGSRTQIIAYPGDLQLRKVLESYNKIKWPEVDFIEQYIKFSTKVTGMEKIDYFFEGNDEKKYLKSISTIFDSLNTIPYATRTLAPFLFEIYERAKQITLLDSFNSETLRELAEVEFQNLFKSLENEVDIVEILRTIKGSKDKLIELMSKFSPFERYMYFQDSIPTTPYISETLSKPFNIEKFVAPNKPVNVESYKKLELNLLNYKPEEYRKNIFPYSSSTYLNYINSSHYDLNNFNFGDIFNVETTAGFISENLDPRKWVKGENTENLFSQKLRVNKDNDHFNLTHILNTPYFHNQLYEDFYKPTFGKYAGSAYLLLNSLPFKDLEDLIVDTPINKLRMATMFKEIGAIHYVPYFLILKWGSIYHRYKNYIYTGTDILNPFLDTNGITKPINGSEFFDNNKGYEFDVPCETCEYDIPVKYSTNLNTGLHPYYDAIYHQIINGYAHFNPMDAEQSFHDNVYANNFKCHRIVINDLNQWTSIVDNSKYQSTDDFYTLLPSYCFNRRIKDTVLYPSTFNDDYQNAFRVIMEDEDFSTTFSGKTFSGHNEYMRNVLTDDFSISSNNKKLFDLIATFSPDILDQFEEIFLKFASEDLNEEIPQVMFPGLSYNSFQSVMKDLIRIKKFTYNNVTELNLKLRKEQKNNFKKVTYNILSSFNVLKLTLGNPKEINSYVLEGFTDYAPKTTFNYTGYDISQLTQENKDLIKLLIGEYPDSGINYYEKFFENFDVKLNEENVRNFRPIILIYAGYIKNKETVPFKDYLKSNIYESPNGANIRLNTYLNFLLPKFNDPGFIISKNQGVNVEFYEGYNDEGLKIELYNYFKSFNDKWASGNSIGQKLLIEEFLFLDKSNRDIGDRGYINLDRFLTLLDSKNAEANLYSAISILLEGSGFDMRALPAYVNFYGKSLSSKTRITPSSTVAENLFGTFLDVDYEDSEPKVVIQYVEGPLSKHPDMPGNDISNKFVDDSFDMSDNNNNPIIITDPSAFTVDTMLKSNRAVAFEVSFGDQNQGIFKGVTLDQSTLKNTTESFGVLENLARSESGAGVYNIDTSLFDYYRQASYACEVSSMGNVMIQPTMYFYLKNIPMFKGSYWITEVSHKIANNTISTTFKGTRLPRAVFPDPFDTFVASFKPIMDKILQSAINTTKKETNSTTGSTITIEQDGQTYTTDPGTIKIDGETLLKVAGITDFGLPYNGYNGEEYIQKISYKKNVHGTNPEKDNEWFRSIVVRMGSEKNQISDDITMNILCNLTKVITDPDQVLWKELKTLTKTHDFYTSKFVLNSSDKSTMISNKKTIFLNPNPGMNDKSITLTPNYELIRNNPTYPNKKLNVTGAVGVGPMENGYGVAMSESLMRKLSLHEGQVVYFKFL